MSLREVNFVRDTIYGIAHLLGIDPEQDLLLDHARAWASAINNHVRTGCGFWPWPEMEVTEERAFRQVWYDDVTYAHGAGEESEVYYIPDATYYRTTATPTLGELPSDLGNWEAISAEEMDYHIAYQQYGKQAIDRFISIDNANPRTNDTRLPWGFMPSGYGVDLARSSGPTVWVTYIPRSPEFTAAPYSDTTAYARGDLVLDIAVGHCYRALRSSTGVALGNTTYWLRQVMPYVIGEYVKYAAAAEQADDVQLRATLAATADTRIKDEVDKLIAQGQVTFYGRRCTVPTKPFGVSWEYYRAYWSSGATA